MPCASIYLQPIVETFFGMRFLLYQETFQTCVGPLQNEGTREDFTTVQSSESAVNLLGIGQLLRMENVALVSTKRSMSHEKLSFIVRTMWATSVGVSGSS